MSLTDGIIVEITQGVWSSTLNLELVPVPRETALKKDGEYVISCVHIIGAWEGSVILECLTTLAQRCAAAMFGTEIGETTDAEIQDAFGELANMVGGNIKSILPGPSQLSLPMVARGREFKFAISSSKDIHNCAFMCGELPLRVRILKKESK